jgi:hypothetical protein
MSGQIKLWCWVQGDVINNIFPIDIRLSGTVTELKEAILARKPSFKGINADSLKPWKVSELY